MALHPPHGPAAPSLAGPISRHVTVPSVEGVWRVPVGLALVGVGVVAVLATSPGAVATWLAWLAIGFVAGVLVARQAWLWAIGGIVVFAGILAWRLEAPGTERIYWWLGIVVAAVLVSLGAVVGSALGAGRSPRAEMLRAWRSASRPTRLLLVAVLVAHLLFLIGFSAFAAAYGTGTLMTANDTAIDCRTPAHMFGWDYQAINYDQASDARLRPYQAVDDRGVLRWACDPAPTPAGTEVVTDDRIRLAGWYIPAARDHDPSLPTVLLIPGYNATKSEILKYAPAFHDRYPVVLMDLRNVGQSSGDQTTMGLLEARDVHAMVDWITATKRPSALVLVANSMGAAAAVGAAIDDPRVDGLILDSMHASLQVLLGHRLEVEEGYPGLPAAWIMAATLAVAAGQPGAAADPVDLLPLLGDRPVLLTHGTADAVDPPAEAAEPNLHAAMAAGVPVALHYCQGAPHGQVVDTCPDAWARWSTSFLEGVLAD
jgi:pimeloyl-ACP methyl ester carboxylesterase